MFSIVIILLLLILVLPGVRIKTEPSAIAKNETVAIKGILCLMIFLNHFSGWFANPDPILYFFVHCGSFMVSVFFFLSAYGLSKSQMAQNQTFKDLILRTLKIFIPFWICDVIYLFAHYSMDVPLNIAIDTKSILLSVVNLAEIVHNSWFVSAIVFLYIVYFLTQKITKTKGIWLFFVVLILASFKVFSIWLTFFAFPVGLLISQKESALLSLRKCKYVIVLSVTVILTLAVVLLKFFGETLSGNMNTIVSDISDILSGALFAFLVYMLVTRVHIGNKVLTFIGEMSYEFYLLHGLGIFFASRFFTTDQPYWFMFVALAFTFVVSFAVNRICKPIFKLLSVGKNK